MAQANDQHDQNLIFNFINYTIITHSYSVSAMRPGQGAAPHRPWILG